ncbi:MAG: hypothetical protein AAF478_08195 [Pseudomonadota bacterium]
MTIIAITLNLTAALAIAMIGIRYLFGPVPAAYHAEILQSMGIAIDNPHRFLFKAFNMMFGFILMALSVSMGVITYFGMLIDNLLWTRLLIVFIGMLSGLPMTLVAYNMEKQTKVRTPWRVGVALTGVIVCAFGLSLL